LLDNNKFLDGISPEVNDLKVLSEVQADENLAAETLPGKQVLLLLLLQADS
jgi:hypothetical protein